MTLLTLLINVMRAIDTNCLTELVPVCDGDNICRDRLIRVGRVCDSADSIVEGEYDIEYVDENGHVHMTWSNEALLLDDSYTEYSFSDLYEELITFENSTGVNLLADDWMLYKSDFDDIKKRVEILEDVLYDPRKVKD